MADDSLFLTNARGGRANIDGPRRTDEVSECGCSDFAIGPVRRPWYQFSG
jgi:hypothetical protein